MSTEDEVRDLMSRAAVLPYGRGRSQLWAEAAALADSAGLEALALRSNLSLIAAYAHGGEASKVLAPFVWCDTLRKRRPELFADAETHTFGWSYKYVISMLRKVPAISRDQCLEILEEMRLHYLSCGDSMRAYHIHKYLLYRDLGEEAAAEEDFQMWQAAAPSTLADCAGCDPAHEIEYFSRRQDWQAACRVGDRALADKGRHCREQPESLLTDMLEPWLRTGRDAEAWAGHVRAYRRYQSDANHLNSLPFHIDYLRLSGLPERLERARRILIRHLPWWEQASFPVHLMDLAISAARLVRELPGDHDVERLTATLPGDRLPWAPRHVLVDPTLAQAEEWFTGLALDLAGQFDRRPGILRPYMVDDVRKRLHSPGLEHPLEANAIPDVSGMTTLDAHDYRISTASEPASGKDPAKAPDPSDSANAPDGEPPLVPVDIEGRWRTLSLPALLEAAATLGPEVRSIHLLRAGQLLCDDPSLGKASTFREAFGTDGGPALGEDPEGARPLESGLDDAWNRARALAEAFLGRKFPVAPTESDGAESDGAESNDGTAFRLMVQARECAKRSDFRGACLRADEAMRIPSPDPLGVRLEALDILASMSATAGYLQEAIDYARGLVNLSAACGLAFLNSTASHNLASLLLKSRRPVEAAEVAQLALLRADSYPYSPVTLGLHACLSEALGALHDEASIGQAALDLANLLELRGDTLGARDCYSRAALAFGDAGNPARSVALWAHALRLTEEADTPLQVAIVLNQYAYAIATQPGRVPEDQIDLMDRLMERRRALLVSPEVETDQTEQWVVADWQRSMGILSWHTFRRRLAMDYTRAAADAFAAAGHPIERGRTLATLVRMALSTGEFDEAEALLDEGESALSGPSFRGHELLREFANLRENVRNARDERDAG